MPWSGTSFATHNHELHGEKADHAARIANAVLRRGAPEGEAIAVANKWAGKHANGGGISGYDDGGSVTGDTAIGGVPPSTQSANPLMQGMVQRYQAMPVEKLTELAARLGGTPQGQLVQRLLAQRRMMPDQAPKPEDQNQASQNTPSYRKGGAVKRAIGGMMSQSEAAPWWTRREAAGEDSGLLHGATPGRADSIQTTAPAGAYIIPADVIAGLGEGNTLSGARVMQAIIGSGPYGTPLPRGGSGRGPPHPPSVPRSIQSELKAGGTVPVFRAKRRSGGSTPNGHTPVDLSDGEFVVSVEDLKRIGGGDINRAHRMLDKWLVQQRKKQIKKLKSLPGPVKSRD